MKGRHDKAVASLDKLGYKGENGQMKIAVIERTLEESRNETENVNWVELFKGNNLRRTIIACMPLTIQSLSGINFAASYSTYYMQLAGFSTAESFKLQIGQQVLSLGGNVISWWLVDAVGRRSLTFGGTSILTVVLFIMGGLAVEAEKPSGGIPGAVQGTVAMILLYCFLYNLTIGATAYTILVETPTSRLRAKTIAFGLAFYFALNLIWQFVLPYMFNPDEANMGAKVAFVFGGLAVVCIVYLFFYQPETAGRTYAELDEMFHDKLPARKFKNHKTRSQMENDRLTGDDTKVASQ